MRKMIGAMALAAAVLTGPAHAADTATLRCVGEELGSDFALSQADRIVAGLSGPDGKLVDVPRGPIDAAVATCGDRNAWSKDARAMAGVITLVAILRGAVEKVLRNEDVDVAAVRAVYDALPEQARRNFLSESKREESSLMAAKLLIARGVNVDSPRSRHIGMLYAALAVTEFVTPLFASA